MDMFGKKVGKEERASLEVAEASRQTEWKRGSFLRGSMRVSSPGILFILSRSRILQTKKKAMNTSRRSKSFCAKARSGAGRSDGEIPEEVIRKLFEMGAFALKIPEAYAGWV